MTHPTDEERAAVRRLFDRRDEPDFGSPARPMNHAAQEGGNPQPAPDPDEAFREFVRDLFAPRRLTPTPNKENQQ